MSQKGFAPPQPSVAVQVLHVRVAGSHTGRPPLQAGVHTGAATQVKLTGSQTGVGAEQCPVEVHCLHTRAPSQMGVGGAHAGAQVPASAGGGLLAHVPNWQTSRPGQSKQAEPLWPQARRFWPATQAPVASQHPVQLAG